MRRNPVWWPRQTGWQERWGKRRISGIEFEALFWSNFFTSMKSTSMSIRKCIVAEVASSISCFKLAIKERNNFFYTKDQRFWKEQKRKLVAWINLQLKNILFSHQVANILCNLSTRRSTGFASWDSVNIVFSWIRRQQWFSSGGRTGENICD